MSDGLVTASYATHEALLAELRAAWPPPRSPNATREADDDREAELAARPPAAALRLADRFGVALVPDDDGWLSIPMAGFGGRWWRAAPGDGLSAFVAGVPAASERSIGVDQTHASVVVGERAIVKWFRRVGPETSRAATLLGHLDAVGYRGIPLHLGTVAWERPDGPPLTVAQGDAFLVGARDGWEWVVERVERSPAGTAGAPEAEATGRELGGFVAGLHGALATPSAVLPGPFGFASPAEVTAWRSAAVATLDDALAETEGSDGEELRRWAPAMAGALDAITSDTVVRIQPVHGDLHAGQVLEWSGGLAVIDVDGNPALAAAANTLRQPVERDLAQLVTSLDHAGRIVERRRGRPADAAIAAWISDAREALLDTYGTHDVALRDAFEVEQECRELVYAARFLPRWRYAPMATLRARFGR